jgi:excisionase family DNA binding protein
MERMYTINEICKELSVARRTVHHWIATKELKAFHLGGKRLTRVWEQDLGKFIQRGGAHGQLKGNGAGADHREKVRLRRGRR